MGVRYDIQNNGFVFDFSHEEKDDIIHLTGTGYQVEAFGQCFYYGYEFADDVDGNVRTAFIKYLKFSKSLRDEPNLTQFIQKAVNNLHKKINLYNFDLVITPESSSEVNEYIIRYIYRFAQPMMRDMQLIKNLPKNISFDMDAYERRYLNARLENGRPRYTETQKLQVKQSIEEMLTLIHQKDYFTIAKDVKKSKMRPFITHFLRFQSEEDEQLCSTIRNQNILVVDDIATSGSTLNEVMRSLRILNEDNKITLFSILGRKDLMVESM